MSSEPDRSISGLLHAIAGNVQGIIRSELLLAKTEIKEEGLRAAKAAPLLIGGAALGLYAFGFLLLACVYALALVLGTWAAALIVAVALGIIAASLLGVGLKRAKDIGPAIPKTIETVKENVQWAKRQAR